MTYVGKVGELLLPIVSCWLSLSNSMMIPFSTLIIGNVINNPRKVFCSC
jgi:hypothetical protein